MRPEPLSRCARVLAIALVTLVSLAIPAGASALVPVGQLAPPIPPPTCGNTTPFDLWQLSVSSGPSYTIPNPGLLVSWTTNATANEHQSLSFKVLRPVAGGGFLVVGHDGPRQLIPSSPNTFPLSIPVQAGDILALNPQSASLQFPVACTFSVDRNDFFQTTDGDATDGQTIAPQATLSEGRLNVVANLLPVPVVARVNPPSGSFEGGRAVTISGSNFASVVDVSFGGVSATRFTVDSESQITAVLPASRTLTRVPVVVTTSAGSASGTFAYVGCVVPRLGGLKLKAAKRKLRKARCAVGKIKRLGDGGPKNAVVRRQRPRPGKVLPPGSKIGLTVFSPGS